MGGEGAEGDEQANSLLSRDSPPPHEAIDPKTPGSRLEPKIDTQLIEPPRLPHSRQLLEAA